MFKATDFKLIRRLCPDELEELLRLLEIDAPNFDDGDEFEIYKELDSAIDKKFCDRLNCNSDLDGYAKLLDRGGIEFDSGETRNSMLKKVLANRETILHGQSAPMQTKNIKITCHLAEAVFDLESKSFFGAVRDALKQLVRALKDKDISRLLPLKKELQLKFSVAEAIKNILVKEYGLRDGDEIIISVVKKNSAPPKKFDSPIQNVDEETFALLEQINKIFDKI